MLFVIKCLQQKFIAPIVYTISEYVSKYERRKTGRENKGRCTETNSGTKGSRREGCTTYFCKESEGRRQGAIHSSKSILQSSGKTRTFQENRIRFLQKVGLTIFYLDFLDSHPHYGLMMLRELWT